MTVTTSDCHVLTRRIGKHRKRHKVSIMCHSSIHKLLVIVIVSMGKSISNYNKEIGSDVGQLGK